MNTLPIPFITNKITTSAYQNSDKAKIFIVSDQAALLYVENHNTIYYLIFRQ